MADSNTVKVGLPAPAFALPAALGGTVSLADYIGVLPEPSRFSSGYRDYDGQAAARLRFIRVAQSVG